MGPIMVDHEQSDFFQYLTFGHTANEPIAMLKNLDRIGKSEEK
jgi:hypothetical protein